VHTVLVNGTAVTPSKIVCIGRNYAAHAAELGNAVPDEMVVFLKPNSAIAETLQSTFCGDTLHFETEISFLVQGGKFAAVGVGLDLTNRVKQTELKTKGLPWERAKAFNGAAVFSEFVAFDGDMDTLRLELRIDGELVQQGGVPMMLFPPAQIVRDLEPFMALEDGDIVMTGTPEGVGTIAAGARFDAAVYSGDTVLVSHSWTAV